MNRLATRLWGLGSAMLRPGDLIDRLLDWIEPFRDSLVPVHALAPSRAKIAVEPRSDQFTA
jgi:hypothetical protein